jgi:hypothetical protein
MLVVEDFVLERAGIPPFWEGLGHFAGKILPDSNRVVEHSVYTML